MAKVLLGQLQTIYGEVFSDIVYTFCPALKSSSLFLQFNNNKTVYRLSVFQQRKAEWACGKPFNKKEKSMDTDFVFIFHNAACG